NQISEVVLADPPGAQERELHIARGGNRHRPGGTAGLGDAVEIGDRGPCCTAGAKKPDLKLLLSLDPGVIGGGACDGDAGDCTSGEPRRGDDGSEHATNAAKDACNAAGLRSERLAELERLDRELA